MPKVSFIVPVYNVAPYLRKCVDSLLAQEYGDYEIILVDDGSTDGSGAICDEYARVTSEGVNELTNERIRVIHQKNGGLSAARNTGIAAAKGEYICFVDSDDYWEPNVLGGLMAQVEREQLDVLRFDYQNVRLKNEGVKELTNEREYEVFEPNKYPHPVDKRGEIVTGECYLDERMSYACYAWQFIIRRAIINDKNGADCALVAEKSQMSIDKFEITNDQSQMTNNVFKVGIHFEDVEWLPRMMLAAKRVNSTTLIVYNYFSRQGSILRTQGDKSRIRKNTEDFMSVIRSFRQLSEKHPSCRWIHRMYSGMVIDVLTTMSRDLYAERETYMDALASMDVYPLNITKQDRSYTIKGIIANISPALLVFLLHLKYSTHHK